MRFWWVIGLSLALVAPTVSAAAPRGLAAWTAARAATGEARAALRAAPPERHLAAAAALRAALRAELAAQAAVVEAQWWAVQALRGRLARLQPRARTVDPAVARFLSDAERVLKALAPADGQDGTLRAAALDAHAALARFQAVPDGAGAALDDWLLALAQVQRRIVITRRGQLQALELLGGQRWQRVGVAAGDGLR